MRRWAPILIPLIFIFGSMKFLQNTISIIPVLVLLIALSVLMFFTVKRLVTRGATKKYQRKPQSPWGALNEGIDPTL